jgi:uncharacterized membrane protein
MARTKGSVEVNAPLEACYRVWIDFENYPRFMTFVKSVRRKGDPNVLQWDVTGPAGKVLSWDSELDAVSHNNRAISWHTVRNADVPNSGAVTLEPTEGQRTRINLVLEYEPPAGIFGDLVGDKLGVADSMVQKTLENFKNLMENPATVGAGSRPPQSTTQPGSTQTASQQEGAAPGNYQI